MANGNGTRPVNWKVINTVIGITVILVGYLVAGITWGKNLEASQGKLEEAHAKDVKYIGEQVSDIKHHVTILDRRQTEQSALLVEIRTLQGVVLEKLDV